MEVNWIVLGILGILIVLLVVYVVKENRKDKKSLTDFLNNDFKKKDESEFNDED
ncbi:hypothetical protein J2X31_000140 [Flavobacterium arsenatis]|uniref:Uncharacterized protein n=1 Tax=Flavobacterium arsenatis TaxID=1484332 RepID=A0ABU1TK29_9FLAO|nr:hypothetical protein [Flavobacterium arsenatis]MDR6966147.1 hypothetical protein [Flavobacterium arsenatis]